MQERARARARAPHAAMVSEGDAGPDAGAAPAPARGAPRAAGSMVGNKSSFIELAYGSLSGMAFGLVSPFAAQPFDVLKTKMQAEAKYARSGVVDVARDVSTRGRNLACTARRRAYLHRCRALSLSLSRSLSLSLALSLARVRTLTHADAHPLIHFHVRGRHGLISSAELYLPARGLAGQWPDRTARPPVACRHRATTLCRCSGTRAPVVSSVARESWR